MERATRPVADGAELGLADWAAARPCRFRSPAGRSPPRVRAAFAADREIPYRSVPDTTHTPQIEKPEAARDAFLGVLASLQAADVTRRA